MANTLYGHRTRLASASSLAPLGVLLLVLPGLLAVPLMAYFTVPGGGTFTRALWYEGVSPLMGFWLASWLVIGFTAGRNTRSSAVLWSIGGAYVGTVIGQLLPYAMLTLGGSDYHMFAGALTLGLTDVGEARYLGGGDPVIVRIGAVLVLLAVVGLGAWLGHLSIGLRGRQ